MCRELLLYIITNTRFLLVLLVYSTVVHNIQTPSASSLTALLLPACFETTSTKRNICNCIWCFCTCVATVWIHALDACKDHNSTTHKCKVSRLLPIARSVLLWLLPVVVFVIVVDPGKQCWWFGYRCSNELRHDEVTQKNNGRTDDGRKDCDKQDHLDLWQGCRKKHSPSEDGVRLASSLPAVDLDTQ